MSSDQSPTGKGATSPTTGAAGASNPPKATSSSPIAVSDSMGVRSFVAQKFSASTEMILKRLRGEGGSFNPMASFGIGTEGKNLPPGYENVKRSVMEGMKTTFNMEIPPVASNGLKKSNGAGAQGGSGSSGMSTPNVGTPMVAGTAAAVALKTGSASGSASKKTKVRGGTRGKAGKKRKRKDDSDDAEESSLHSDSDSSDVEYTQLPTKTLSGRKVVKPTQFDPAAHDGHTKRRASTASSSPFKRSRSAGSMEKALCKRCSRGISPTTNMIVFCDDCDAAWHQMCHDPRIPDELVKDEKKKWYCKDCVVKSAAKAAAKAPLANAPQTSSNSSNNTAYGEWQSKTLEEKRAHLSTLSQAQLVTLILQAEIQHPAIATLFPNITLDPSSAPSSQQRQQNHPAQAQAQAQATQPRATLHTHAPFPPFAPTGGLFTRAEANPNATMNFIRKISPSSGSPSPIPTSSTAPPTSQQQHQQQRQQQATPASPAISLSGPSNTTAANITAPAEETPVRESRESTPASPPYPRPGTGLMADLPPDDQDFEWLVGHVEEPAFSHIVFDEGGKAHKVL